jgi:hypothetical protein
MSYILKQNNEEIAKSNNWNPALFGNITQTSYPKNVEQSYIWEHEDYWLGWENDPEPPVPTPEEIAIQQSLQNEQLRTDAYRNESDPIFFKAQRGEATMEEWIAKVNEIKTRYPKD